jgi:large subunit ribosomal protein L10
VKRAEKTAAVERMNADFQSTPHVILASFRGLSVNQANELRRKVDSVGGRYQVIKNRLAKRAAAGTNAEPLADLLTGPCAVVLHDSDPVALAKALAEFAKANPELELRGGVVDAKDVVDAAEVKRLATLPGLQELRAQLLSLIQGPASGLARLLNTPGGQIARAVDARRETLGEAPAE